MKRVFKWLSLGLAGLLLLAGVLYLCNVVGTYLLIDKGEVYLSHLPKSDTGAHQQIVFVDNYSSKEIEKLEFTLKGDLVQIAKSQNVASA